MASNRISLIPSSLKASLVFTLQAWAHAAQFPTPRSVPDAQVIPEGRSPDSAPPSSTAAPSSTEVAGPPERLDDPVAGTSASVENVRNASACAAPRDVVPAIRSGGDLPSYALRYDDPDGLIIESDPSLVLFVPPSLPQPLPLRVSHRKSKHGSWYEVETYHAAIDIWTIQATCATEGDAIGFASGIQGEHVVEEPQPAKEPEAQQLQSVQQQKKPPKGTPPHNKPIAPKKQIASPAHVLPDVQVGQTWRGRDARGTRARVVEIIEIDPKDPARVRIRTMASENTKAVGRTTWAERTRFSGKSGGYELVQATPSIG